MADDISLVVGVDYTELTGLIKTTDQTKRALSSISREFAKTGDQKQYMRGINQLVAAQKRLDESSRLSRSELMKLGAQMQQEAKFAKALTNATMGLSNAQMAATKSSNRMGVVTQQAGYQVSDFIVQVQSGTNAFVAFGQQASQLVGVLPLIASPLGLTAGAAVALSAGLGIAIPLVTAVGAAISRSGKAAKEASEDLKTYEEALESLSKRADDLQKKRLSLTTEFDEDALIASEKRNQLADLIARKQIEAIGYTGQDLELSQNLIAGLEEQLAKETEIVSNALKRVRLEEERLEKVKEAAEWEEGAEDRRSEFLKRRDDFLGYFNAQIEANAKAEQDAIEKAEKLEKSRQKVVEDNFKTLMKSIAANDRLNSLVSEERKELEYQNTLLQLQLQFGKDSAAVKQLQIDRAVENYEAELLLKGVAEDTVKELTDQYRLSLNLTEQLKDQVAQAREFKKQVQEVSKSYGKMLEKRILADVLDPRGEAGVTATQALRLGINPFADGGEDDKTTRTKRDPLADLQKQVELEQALIGKTQARQRIIQALGVDFEKYGDKTINNLEAQINRTIMLEDAERKRQEAVEEAKRQQEDLAQSIGDSFESAFMSIVDGTKSVEDAFRTMAAEIIKELYRVFVVKQITGFITNAVGAAMAGPVQGPMLPSANGNVFSRGSLVPYANGGIVGSPTLFPMAGGRTGLMGEAGPEAIMPLKRGKGGKLGVAVEGGQQPVVINQSFNFAANGDDSVKRIIAQQAPKIAQMTTQQIMDSRRRGGQMKAVFG